MKYIKVINNKVYVCSNNRKVKRVKTLKEANKLLFLCLQPYPFKIFDMVDGS